MQPLRLSNVDENVAREIDDVLSKEYDKEEILRKVGVLSLRAMHVNLLSW